jgi:hypothetical protein
MALRVATKQALPAGRMKIYSKAQYSGSAIIGMPKRHNLRNQETKIEKKDNIHGHFEIRNKHPGRLTTATFRRNLIPTFQDRGMSRGQRG